jgi:hypothetical protein
MKGGRGQVNPDPVLLLFRLVTLNIQQTLTERHILFVQGFWLLNTRFVDFNDADQMTAAKKAG